MTNKFGFRTCGFAKWKFSDACATLKELGYDGVELCLEGYFHGDEEDLKADEIRTALREISDAGLEVASFSFHGDGQPLPLRWKRTKAAIDLTGECGAETLVLNAPRIVPGKKEKQFGKLMKRWRKFCKRAESNSVKLAIEPEPLLVIEGGEDMLRAIDEVDSEALCVNLDIGHNWITDQDVPEYIRLLDKRIVHTHFEDIAHKVHQHLVPGEGDLPIKAVHTALQEIAYAGYLTIDLFRIQDAPDDFAKRALSGLRKAIR